MSPTMPHRSDGISLQSIRRNRSGAFACFIGSLLFIAASTSFAAEKTPSAQVTVSKPAASLPGPLYGWISMPQRLEAEKDIRVQDIQLRARIRSAIDKALQAKGYRLAGSPGQANFNVAYRVGVRDMQDAQVKDNEPASAPEAAIECRAGGCSQIVTRGDDGALAMQIETTDYVQGGLLVEILEPGAIRVLWRALYTGTVRGPKDGSQSRLDAVASETLAELPKATAPVN